MAHAARAWSNPNPTPTPTPNPNPHQVRWRTLLELMAAEKLALEEQLRAIQWSTGIRIDEADEDGGEEGGEEGDEGIVSIARYRSAMAAAAPPPAAAPPQPVADASPPATAAPPAADAPPAATAPLSADTPPTDDASPDDDTPPPTPPAAAPPTAPPTPGPPLAWQPSPTRTRVGHTVCFIITFSFYCHIFASAGTYLKEILCFQKPFIFYHPDISEVVLTICFPKMFRKNNQENRTSGNLKI